MTAGLSQGARDQALRLLYPPVSPYLRDPAGWVTDRLGEHLWSRQRDVAQALVEHRRVAVPAAHAMGKSFLAARLTAWWLDPDVHPAGTAFVVTTAPSFRQVKNILWRELGAAHAKAELPGRVTLTPDMSMRVNGQDQVVAVGYKPPDAKDAAQAATLFQGLHARYFLAIVDEACGVQSAMWRGIDSLMTNEDARVLAIGNPTSATAEFAAMCAPDSDWHVVRMDGLQSPNFTGEPVPEGLSQTLLSRTAEEEMARRYGQDSGYYQARVRAIFPTEDDDTALIPVGLLQRATELELPDRGEQPGRLTVDVARMGGDECVVGLWQDGRYRMVDSWRGRATTQSTARIRELWMDRGSVHEVVVDADGLGAGVYDELRAASGQRGTPPMTVRAFRAAAKPRKPERFKNRRAEAWWALRLAMQSGEVDLDPDDQELLEQLGSIRWEEDARGRIKVESKDDMRARGIGSPDRADTLMMSASRTLAEPAPQRAQGHRPAGRSPAAGIFRQQW